MGIIWHTMSDRGVSDLWSSVNHIAIVVSDVGTSLSFYTDIIGMKQVFRPNFDRHGAWLTFGNVDLHLIKGRPAVHSDDDLIVSHIAITVSDMETMREKLKSLGCPTEQTYLFQTQLIQTLVRLSKLLYEILMDTTSNFAIVKSWKNSFKTKWPSMKKSGIFQLPLQL